MPSDSINLLRTGSGPPLLLVHGLGSDLHAWDPVRGRLATEFDVIAVDMPGFGDSRPLAEDVEPTPAALAVRLGQMLDELGVDSAHVVGNSLGGWVAFELALLGRTKTVTGVCPAGLWPRPLRPAPPTASAGQRAASLLRPFAREAMGVDAIRRAALSMFVAHPDQMSTQDAKRIIDAYARASDHARTNAAMRSGRFTRISEILVPTTVAFAERDRLISPVPLPANVNTVSLPDCGHLPMFDNPGLVVELITGATQRS